MIQPDKEFAFIAGAVEDDTYLNAYGTCTRCPYALYDFRDWIATNMGTIPFQWDHFAYITG